MGCPMITIKKCFYLLLINQIFTAFTYRRLCSPSPCLNGLIFSVLHIINDTPTITNKVSQGQTPLVFFDWARYLTISTCFCKMPKCIFRSIIHHRELMCVRIEEFNCITNNPFFKLIYELLIS